MGGSSIKQHQERNQQHTNGYARVRDVKHRPTVHDEVRKVGVEEIRDLTVQRTIDRVTNRAGEEEQDRPAQSVATTDQDRQVNRQRCRGGPPEDQQQCTGGNRQTEGHAGVQHIGKSYQIFTDQRDRLADLKTRADQVFRPLIKSDQERRTAEPRPEGRLTAHSRPLFSSSLRFFAAMQSRACGIASSRLNSIGAAVSWQ